jgi:hypothetical protein
VEVPPHPARSKKSESATQILNVSKWVFLFCSVIFCHIFLKVGLAVTGCLATGGKYHLKQDEKINSGRERALPKADIFDKLLF